MKCFKCSNNAECFVPNLNDGNDYLCNHCEFDRLSCLNNIDNPNTIEEFWNGVEK